MLRITENLVN